MMPHRSRIAQPAIALILAGLFLAGCGRSAVLTTAPHRLTPPEVLNGAKAAPQEAAPAEAVAAATPQQPEAVPGEVIVRFKGEARELPGATRKGSLTLPNTYVYAVNQGGYSVQAIEEWEDAEDIDYVEPNYVYYAVGTPNDPMYHKSWGVGASKAPAVWSQTRGAGVKVAVIDTGVNPQHPDLVGRVVTGWDAVNKDHDASDDHGHGTHVAGTIAAIAGNGLGVAGMAPDATIIPIKVLNAKGSGTNDGIAEGILKAAELGAKVINMSLGGPDNSETLKRAIAQVQAQGVVVIAAAGNDNVNTPFYPAANEGVIGVAAVDTSDRKASFSNYGDYVDIAAPGVNIVSTGFKGDYVGMNGTSMASPHVAGAAALLLGAHPQLNAGHVSRLLQIGGRTSSGFGMSEAPRVIDVAAAMAKVSLLDLSPPSRVQALTAEAGAPGEIELSWAPSSDNVAVAGYKVFRDGEVVETVGKTGFTDRGLSAGKSYSYRVVAFDVDGNESTASAQVSGTSGEPSKLFTDLGVSKREAKALTIRWEAETPLRVSVEWGEGKELGQKTTLNATAATSHEVKLDGLKRFKRYYYRVVATDASGKKHYSETQKTRTKLWWLFSVN
ncbi:MAG: S8 family serine peptidase [Candidatus Sericytochromatia bacterium]